MRLTSECKLPCFICRVLETKRMLWLTCAPYAPLLAGLLVPPMALQTLPPPSRREQQEHEEQEKKTKQKQTKNKGDSAGLNRADRTLEDLN